MLRDPKNAEFKDQIYYALAELAVKDGNIREAKRYYTQSILWSIKNDRQKGISYLRLGDISFDEKNYVYAQKYYDSCVQVLPEDYESYDAIKAKAEGLTDLVFHYERYVFEDSVQRIAQMSDKEMEKYLEKTLKQMKEAEKKRKEEEAARLLEQQSRINSAASNVGSGSKWYFYNTKIKGSGFNDFRSLWGQRVLEDNWRRSAKGNSAIFEDDTTGTGDSTDFSQDIDSLTVDDLRANLPLTDEALVASNDNLMNSLYMLGVIYKEHLKEYTEATTYFTKVLDRGVAHPKVLPALYQLYLLKKGTSEGDMYRSRILKEYPDSEIAQILVDPDYLKKKEEKEKAEYLAYSNTYEKYRYHKFSEVLDICEKVITTDTTNQFLNKYYLLKAFCLSQLKSGNEAAISEPLVELIKRSPDSEEGKQAKIYLGKLNGGGNITDTVDDKSANYTVDMAAKHFFVVILKGESNDMAKAKIKLSNFSKEYFRSKNLDIQITPMGADVQLLRVRTFDNADDAKNYRETYASDAAKSSLGTMASDYEFFEINLENFKELSTKKDLPSYLEFYKANY